MQNYNYFPENEPESVNINGKEFPVKLIADINSGYIAGLVYTALNFLSLFFFTESLTPLIILTGICCFIGALSYGVKKRNRWAALALFLTPIIVTALSSRIATSDVTPSVGRGGFTMLPLFILMYFLGRAAKASFEFHKIDKSVLPIESKEPGQTD